MMENEGKDQDGSTFLMRTDNKQVWSNPNFWTELCPTLHIAATTTIITNKETSGKKEDRKAAAAVAVAAAAAEGGTKTIHIIENKERHQNKTHIKEEEEEEEEDRKIAAVVKSNKKGQEHQHTHTQKCLVRDGYALMDQLPPSIDHSPPSPLPLRHQQLFHSLVKKLKTNISLLYNNKHHPNIPATFILLFDETWKFAWLANHYLLKPHTHMSNQFNFDILAWYIDPKQNHAGFSPHRDRQESPAAAAAAATATRAETKTLAGGTKANNNKNSKETICQSFHADGQAKYVTLWTALSDATTENSCLYMIPKHADPGYMNGDDDDDDDKKDPLQTALSTKESYQNIRAIPRTSGQSVLFTHRILHWGSKGNPDSSSETTEPRIAISLVCSDTGFEKPYLKAPSSSSSSSWSSYFSSASSIPFVDGDNNSNKKNGQHPVSSELTPPSPPPFHIRLLLVCAQLLIYYQRFDLPKNTIRACYEYVKQYGDLLEPTYQQKVTIEFVKAMKEATISTTANAAESVAAVTKKRPAPASARSENIAMRPAHKNNGNKNENENDDEEDIMLEAMLDAELEGYGDEFVDDYDELDGDGEDFDDHDDDDDDEDYDEDGKKLTSLFRKPSKRIREEGNDEVDIGNNRKKMG